MDLDKKILKQAYRPFVKQICLDCFRYTIYCIALIVAFYIMGNCEFMFPWVSIMYSGICIWRFKLVFFSILETKFKIYKKVLVHMTHMEMDGWLGEYKNENSYIKKYYADSFSVERNKIHCVDANDKRYTLRIIGSSRKMQVLTTLFLINQEKVYVVYGRLTKIILLWEQEDNKKTKNSCVKMLNNIF